jgi:hypothetical protein
MCVPLRHYRDQADTRLHCLPCAYGATYKLERVIRRLNTRGIDGENTGVKDLGRLTVQDCPRCGAKSGRPLPAFHPIPGRDGAGQIMPPAPEA